MYAATSMNHDADAHGLRTARLTALLCPVLDVPADEAELIVRAAHIHDIGKQFISESLLAKPEPLTPDERKRIEQHCVLGAWMVMSQNDDPLHSPAIEIAVALSHHEWWNGQGYPFGLAGRTIARPARIVAVADVFDALLTARAYKPAWSHDRALDYMKRGRGVQFDPDCVDALLHIAAALPAGWRDAAHVPHGGERHPAIFPSHLPSAQGVPV